MKKMNFESLWHWPLTPKVTNFNRIRASVLSNHLAKTAFKSVHPFGWNFVHKQSRKHRQTHSKLQWKYNPSTISWRCNHTRYFSTFWNCFYYIGMTIIKKMTDLRMHYLGSLQGYILSILVWANLWGIGVLLCGYGILKHWNYMIMFTKCSI